LLLRLLPSFPIQFLCMFLSTNCNKMKGDCGWNKSPTSASSPN
jgi:hypothetical protein